MKIQILFLNGGKLFIPTFWGFFWLSSVFTVISALAVPVFADEDVLSGPLPDETPHLSFPKPLPQKTEIRVKNKKILKKKKVALKK